MRTNVHRIRRAIPGNLKRAGTEVVLKWNVYPAGATPDPQTGAMMISSLAYQSGTPYQSDGTYLNGAGSVVVAVPIELEETIMTFLHTPDAAKSDVMRFNEIKMGDLIMEFSPELELECRADLRVCVGGKEWSAKKLSQELAETWDALQGGEKLYKTVLLRRSLGGYQNGD